MTHKVTETCPCDFISFSHQLSLCSDTDIAYGGYFACICSWTGCMYYHRSNTVTSQMSACVLPLPTPKSTITPIPPLSSFSSKISPWALGRPTSACAVRMYFVFVLVWFWLCFDWFVSLFLFLRFYVRVQDRWWLLGPADGFWWPAARSWSSKYFIFIFTQVQKKRNIIPDTFYGKS